jgi:phenol 2-monooxygenase
MQDAFNLGWKLAAVLRGQAVPQLLDTYSAERQAVARELIDFDREWARMLSAPMRSPGDPSGQGVEPAEVQKYFVRHGRYTAGTATKYRPSIISAEPRWLDLAKGFPIGMRFHSAPVIRLADARPLQLGHVIDADGRWRLFAFGDAENPANPACGIARLCAYLAESPDSPVTKFTVPGTDTDSVFDVRAIFQQGHRELAIGAMPPLLRPAKGRYGLRDYEKLFCPDLKGGNDIFDLREIDRRAGCLVIVRPDQYVAHVLPLDAHAELTAFFDEFMRRAS